jgi:hypothetical protein
LADKGLCCPQCGTNLNEVVETRRGLDSTLRTRRCFNGHKFKTCEGVLPEDTRTQVADAEILLLLAQARKLPHLHPERNSMTRIAEILNVPLDRVRRLSETNFGAIRTRKTEKAST